MRERCVQVAGKAVDEPSEDVVAIANQQRAARRNPFARIALFIRQVIAELKKVVTPTRKELGNYVVVVLIFVVIMMALVSLLDWVFALAVTYVFGTPAA
ncbi:preprotein translocase subunit SecE [Rathayibacter rathayi NCPPB 2980 = VKM Ac-1601]|nr:preprotein translocase subunit SecE [Rathayibacter rathayi]SOE01904.1 preprotein translocase subunit SecE [Rathayibacter rathayi NCPPB 2980 = VKM Ac-1601]